MDRILLDARPVGDGHHGIARYILSLAPHLAAAEGTEWTAVCGPWFEERFRALGMRTVVTSLAFTSPLAPLQLARIQREIKPDVTFCPSFVPAWPTRGPLVMTLHDATHLLRPGDYSPLVNAYYRAVTLPGARRSQVITVSEYSKRELERLGGLREVTVIPNGVDHEVFRPDGPWDGRIGERTVLYAGGYKPHKRVPMLVEAVAALDGVRLALVGEPPEELRVVARNVLGDRLLLLGRLADKELAAACRAATVFAYPSVLEGFGLPPLEAMACGTPVVVAHASSLPEVVGGAGVLVDDGAAEFAGAIGRLMADREECERRRVAGFVRASGFSWERAGRSHVALLLDRSRGQIRCDASDGQARRGS